MAKKALEGLRILDLTRILAGPLVTQMLGDLGADVIKVERPGKGDDAREMGPPFLRDREGKETDLAGFFLCCNRNKRSITVDIASAEGQGVVRQLVEKCDVVVENFKVGSLMRFGLDYDSLRSVKPDLIYCSITGFGQDGPLAAKPGYDGIFQAMSGLMSVSGRPDADVGGGPMKVGLSIVDIITSYQATIAVLAALHHRNIAGEGQAIDISLLDCGLAAMSHYAQNYLITGEIPERRGNGGYGGIPSQSFECADRSVFVVVGNDAQYQRFCNAIGQPGLIDDARFRTGPLRIKNRKLIVPILEAIFRKQRAAHWVAALDRAGVPVGFVNDIGQAFQDPQVRARNMLVEISNDDFGTLPIIASPLRFSRTPVDRYSPPPRLGEHSAEVLSELLDLDGAAIQELRERGAVG